MIIVSPNTLESDANQNRLLNSILNYEYNYSTALNLASLMAAGNSLISFLTVLYLLILWSSPRRLEIRLHEP